ncbi:MAG: hypothetical protein ACI978_001600 [Oleispira sp.]|jgi:hypothetical protein
MMITNTLEYPLILDPKQYEASHLALVKNTQDKDMFILKEFEQHSLTQQNTAALMNRVDNKYVLPIELFNPLMAEISADYSILNAYGRRIFNYQTTYFDNKERQFYRDHHNGKLNRYKVRYRRYVESDMGYMEIKFKNNQKRTDKQRIPMDCILPDQIQINDFVKSTLGYSIELETVLFVNYQRITLLNKKNLERITLDLNLSFRNANNSNESIQDQVFIVEIKQNRKPFPSSCRNFIKHHGYQAINFSKYCMGSVLTDNKEDENSPLKYNRFKSVLRRLEKINAQH